MIKYVVFLIFFLCSPRLVTSQLELFYDGDPTDVDDPNLIKRKVGNLTTLGFENGEFDEDDLELLADLLSDEGAANFKRQLWSKEYWYGEIGAERLREGGYANLYISPNKTVTGSLYFNNASFSISTLANGDVEVEKILDDDFPSYLYARIYDELIEEVEEEIEEEEEQSDAGGRTLRSTQQQRELEEDTEYVDVMIVYTLRAMCAEAGLGGVEAICNVTEENKGPIESRAQLGIEETNTAYEMSGIKGRMRLVYTGLVDDYDDRLTEGVQYDQMLNDLTYKDDGKLDSVHVDREKYGADLVSMWVENPEYCGLAWATPQVKEAGFSVVQRSCATGYFSFGHETGHNFGALHDDGHTDVESEFAYGFQNPADGYRTIMAYQCETTTCGKVQRFSTPDILINGEPLGNATSNNARQIKSTWNTVANYLPSRVSETGDTHDTNVTEAPGDSEPSSSASYVLNPFKTITAVLTVAAASLMAM